MRRGSPARRVLTVSTNCGQPTVSPWSGLSGDDHAALQDRLRQQRQRDHCADRGATTMPAVSTTVRRRPRRRGVHRRPECAQPEQRPGTGWRGSRPCRRRRGRPPRAPRRSAARTAPPATRRGEKVRPARRPRPGQQRADHHELERDEPGPSALGRAGDVARDRQLRPAVGRLPEHIRRGQQHRCRDATRQPPRPQRPARADQRAARRLPRSRRTRPAVWPGSRSRPPLPRPAATCRCRRTTARISSQTTRSCSAGRTSWW